MRRWVFEDAAGRYDIDLGDSFVPCGQLAQLDVPADLALGYGVDRGTPELAELVAGRYGGSAEHVLITHGAQEALYLLYCTLLRPGDRVIAFTPGWQQAQEVPARLGCRVEVVALADDFSIDLTALAAAAGPDLRVITVNSPSNPTGRRVRPVELAAIVALAERTGAYVVLDEEYVLDLRGSAAMGSERVVSVSGLSKTCGFPGLRVGWLYGSRAIVAACTEYKHHTTISNSVLCEALAVQVLRRWEHYAREYQRLTDAGLACVVEWADEHRDDMRLVPPEGTPFAWCRLTTGESSLSFARRVLHTGVLIMPGETLGATEGFRVTFAREPAQLIDGLRRIGKSFYRADTISGSESRDA